ncbi:hypothetical protein PHYSODRAFT_340877 [Phytophthora sojae]|uniref:Uncharacterized protein n=1 Tax=Phytophthora sojae (strain P6497) TaxID=1094619 RepID=G5ABD2_PHYSP|nr:hypothetical protein PHYSODRAFT_340877 [Phytophthora sojae]EGZ06657.1 hypothetical protein PHYSODRAFT_340877 [Phytophthora sojae]|eukprot:XP_009537421.1 hypothetical protein PHYSODRAFT_340877 [Phytophthora sojae]
MLDGMSLYDAACSFTNRYGTPQPIPTNANAIFSHGLIHTDRVLHRLLVVRERRLQDDARFYSIGCQTLDDTKTVWQTYTELTGFCVTECALLVLDKLNYNMQRENQRRSSCNSRFSVGVAMRERDPLPATAPTAKTTLYKVRARGTDVSVRVPITRHDSTNQALALKCMPKALIVENYLQKNVIYEKGIIAECDRPITFKLREMYQEANQASGKDTSAIGIVRRGDRWVV